jgi:uncharacterized membrane protein SpoIIM required for sporulation
MVGLVAVVVGQVIILVLLRLGAMVGTVVAVAAHQALLVKLLAQVAQVLSFFIGQKVSRCQKKLT